MVARVTATASTTPTLEGEGLELRPWDEGLALQMAQWGERGFPYAGFNLGYLKNAVSRAETLAFVHAQDQHRHFVGCREGIAVGRVSVNVEDRAGCYLWAVHVPPEREGQGIARAMLRVVCGWLRETYPEREVLLTTNSFAERAHRTYEAVGFEVVETRWQGDTALSGALLTLTHEERQPIESHIRFRNGRWEVRVDVMKLRELERGPRRGKE